MNTQIIELPCEADYRKAAECLRNSGLVAFPTETVYGLGGNALDPSAARRIYAAKGRPSDNPLIIHLAYAEEAEKYCETSQMFYRLAMAFMPGPLTVILKKKSIIPDEVTGGLDTVAVRVPSHPVAHRLLEVCDFPIAAPSANISGKPSPTCLHHVKEDMDGKIEMILGGGQCSIGVESTIVKIDGEELSLLRPGAITVEMLAPFCKCVSVDPALERPLVGDEHPLAPGMKYKHYAPKAEVVLLDGADEQLFSFFKEVSGKEDIGILCPASMFSLLSGENTISLGGNLAEEARVLFGCLREYDRRENVKTIYAPLPSKEGIGLAVYNRLIKAAGFTVLKLK